MYDLVSKIKQYNTRVIFISSAIQLTERMEIETEDWHMQRGLESSASFNSAFVISPCIANDTPSEHFVVDSVDRAHKIILDGPKGIGIFQTS